MDNLTESEVTTTFNEANLALTFPAFKVKHN